MIPHKEADSAAGMQAPESSSEAQPHSAADGNWMAEVLKLQGMSLEVVIPQLQAGAAVAAAEGLLPAPDPQAVQRRALVIRLPLAAGSHSGES